MFWFNCSKLTMFSYIDESIISHYVFLYWWIYNLSHSHSLSLSLFVDQFSQFSQFVRICHNFHNFLLRERSFKILWFSLPFSRGLFVFSPVWKMGGKISGHTSSQHSTGLAALSVWLYTVTGSQSAVLLLLHCVVAADSWFMLHLQYWGK